MVALPPLELAEASSTIRRMLFSVRRQPGFFPFLSIIIAVAGALLQSGCTVAAPAKVSNWKNSTGAEAYQRLFWQAVKEKDWLQVESHMASNFTYLNSGGSKDKQQTVDYLRSLELKDFSLGEINVNASGNDAIVTYTI